MLCYAYQLWQLLTFGLQAEPVHCRETCNHVVSDSWSASSHPCL